MEDRLDNAAYQADLSIINSISILCTKHMNAMGRKGTYEMKPSWLTLLFFILDLHYYHKNKEPLFYGRFIVSSYTVAVSFKAFDDAYLAGYQLKYHDGATIITNTFENPDDKFTYSKLYEDSEEYIFLDEAISNILTKVSNGSGSFNLHQELLDFGYYDLIDKYVYPQTGIISIQDYNYMTNKYFKGVEKTVNKTISPIKSSSNVIQFDRIKK
jgi:hypothetical protein